MTATSKSARHAAVDRVHHVYQLAFLLVDFSAAALFVAGSILFFYPDLTRSGTWMFLVGSVFFAVKPTLRLARFLHLRALTRRTETSLERVLDRRHFF